MNFLSKCISMKYVSKYVVPIYYIILITNLETHEYSICADIDCEL